MKKLKLTMCLFMIGIMCAKAQIGYQVSLLNTATGEPRANETVTVSVSFSDCEGKVFYSETKSATTNDFGVLSLSVGNADTFKEVDLTKMPFFIEATANGVMIGKSQILNVPVAEVAKQLAPTIKKEEICGKKWNTQCKYHNGSFITFYFDGTCEVIVGATTHAKTYAGEYVIQGNIIYACYSYLNDWGEENCYVSTFCFRNGKLYHCYIYEPS